MKAVSLVAVALVVAGLHPGAASAGRRQRRSALEIAARVVGSVLSLPPLGRIRRHLNVTKPSKRSADPVRVEEGPRLVVASHNVMDGNKLDDLLPRYMALRDHSGLGLDMLMVQENKRWVSSKIARGLGSRYTAINADDADNFEGGPSTRLSIVYDAKRFRLIEQKVVALPKVARLTRAEAMVIKAGVPEQKYAQIAIFAPVDGGEPFTAVNFHLDAAGSTAHRQTQMKTIAAAIEHNARGRPIRAVIGGDTNGWPRPDSVVKRITQRTDAARSPLAAKVGKVSEILVSLAAMTYTSTKKQRSTLRRIAQPLTELGATDPGNEPTHVLSRMEENHNAHKVIQRLYEKVGDHNARFDGLWTVGFAQPMGGPVSRVLDAAGSDHRIVYRVLKP